MNDNDVLVDRLCFPIDQEKADLPASRGDAGLLISQLGMILATQHGALVALADGDRRDLERLTHKSLHQLEVFVGMFANFAGGAPPNERPR